MNLTRRHFLMTSALMTLGCHQRVSPSATESSLPIDEAIVQSMKRAHAYLAQRQSKDGGWRSDIYGTFKDGTALTPLVTVAFQESHRADESTEQPEQRGLTYLANLVREDGTIAAPSYGFDFPLYTASLSLLALAHSPEKSHRAKIAVWRDYLLKRQLNNELGWKPEHREFGGWGYCRIIPRRPEPGVISAPYLESNLSATIFALRALDAADIPDDHPAYDDALIFVKRCQNWHEDAEKPDARFDDGGFHFIYADPVRNKAGVAGTDKHGHKRFHSYGSTTADGLQALRFCGLPDDHPRVRAALSWLQEHFRADTNPGTFAPTQRRHRDGAYYYYADSVSRALGDLRITSWESNKEKVNWAELLARALIDAQREDGSWRNPIEEVREDEPLIATSFALQALARIQLYVRRS